MEGALLVAPHRTKPVSCVKQLRRGILCSTGVLTAVALLGLLRGMYSSPDLEPQELGVLQVDTTLDAGSPEPVRAAAATNHTSLSQKQDEIAWKQRVTPEHAACKAFTGTQVESAAVVGNGPITDRQREEISKHGIVVRFNFLNNMWREQERMDVWAVRYSFDAKHRFWGFGQMPLAEALAVLNKTKALWLISSESHRWAVDELIKDMPQVEQHLPTFVNQDDFFYGEDRTAPSTGYIGLSVLRACLPPTVKVHIYGMNWTPKIWEGHDVDDEAERIRQMERRGQVQIHKAPCKGLRTCQIVELDSDCHFDLRRRFVCPKVNSDGHPLDEREFGTAREVIVHAATRHTDYIGDIARTHGKFRRKRPQER